MAALGPGIDRELPFASGFAPRVEEALGLLDPSTPLLAPSARDDLALDLARRLCRTAGRAVTTLFEPSPPTGSTRRYERFIAHLATAAGRDEVRRSFPVLDRLLDLLVLQWVTSVGEMLVHLEADRDHLAHHVGTGGCWGPVRRAVGSLGDPHRGGRTVWRLEPEAGSAVAYKPRPMAAEVAVYDQLRQLVGPAIPWAADGGDHGWMGWVEPTPVRDVPTFWANAGTAAAILYLGGATDLHYGNVVPHGDAVVPVDLECVGFPLVEDPATHAAYVRDSILTTGLLPGWFGHDGPVARDASGLFGCPSQTDGRWYPSWRHLGTDAICRSEVIGQGTDGVGRARTADGREVVADVDALVAGFDATLDLLVDRSFSLPEAPTRFLLRSTSVYADRLLRLTEADALADEAVFADLSVELPAAGDGWKADVVGDAEAEVVRAESEALRRLDVPLHEVVGRHLVLDGGIVLEDRFLGSGAEHAAARRRRLGGAGRRVDGQLMRIHAERARGASAQPRSAVVADVSDATDAALTIADQLVDGAVGPADRPTWPEIDATSAMLGFSGSTSLAGLYDGSAGVAVFLAAVAATVGRPEHARLARVALWGGGSVDDGDSETWPAGRAGHAYAAMVVGRLLDDEELVVRAVGTLGNLLETEHTAAGPLDLVGGAAGVVCAALAALDTGHASGLADVAAAAAAALTADVRARLSDPVGHRAVRRIGAAHGGTGIAYALARAARTLDVDVAGELAAEILHAEDDRVERRGGVGATLVSSGAQMVPRPGWCAGAAGYVLLRGSAVLAATSPAPTDHMRATIAALSGPLAEQRAGLCCGDAGVLVALDTGGRSEPSAAVAAGPVRDRLIAQVAGETPMSFVPGCSHHGANLFLGRAGIGYALLHGIAPDQVPNVLLVE